MHSKYLLSHHDMPSHEGHRLKTPQTVVSTQITKISSTHTHTNEK